MPRAVVRCSLRRRYTPVLGTELIQGKEEEELSREQRALVRHPRCCWAGGGVAAPPACSCGARVGIALRCARQSARCSWAGCVETGVPPSVSHPPRLPPQVDYYLGLEAQRFIGNSVSTFTAFIILERQWAHRWGGAGVEGAVGACGMAGPGRRVVGSMGCISRRSLGCWPQWAQSRVSLQAVVHVAGQYRCFSTCTTTLPAAPQALGALQRRQRATEHLLPLLRIQLLKGGWHPAARLLHGGRCRRPHSLPYFAALSLPCCSPLNHVALVRI